MASRRATVFGLLTLLSGCFLSHRAEEGEAVEVVLAERDPVTGLVVNTHPATGARVRAERCDDGMVREAVVGADGRAWLGFDEVRCWTLTALHAADRPTAVTLVEVDVPMAQPVVLDQHAAGEVVTDPPEPTGQGVRGTIRGRSAPSSLVSLHSADGLSFALDTSVLTGERLPNDKYAFRDVVFVGWLYEGATDGTLLAIEWDEQGRPINSASTAVRLEEVGEIVIQLPSPSAPIEQRELTLSLPSRRVVRWDGSLEISGHVRALDAQGRRRTIGALELRGSTVEPPTVHVEATWPSQLPASWHPGALFSFALGPEPSAGAFAAYLTAHGPTASPPPLWLEPIEMAAIGGERRDGLHVDVGGAGYVGFAFVQAPEDPFVDTSRWRIFSAPDRPLQLRSLPSLPGGSSLLDLGIGGDDEIQVTIGASATGGNPGWMALPVEEERGVQWFLDSHVLWRGSVRYRSAQRISRRQTRPPGPTPPSPGPSGPSPSPSDRCNWGVSGRGR